LDRSSSGVPLATEYKEKRQCDMMGKQIILHLFVDVSSVEIFANEGEEVFTSRIFPSSQSEGIQFFAQEGSARLEATIWQLQQQGNSEE
jgi:beta-fructofuranosidase